MGSPLSMMTRPRARRGWKDTFAVAARDKADAVQPRVIVTFPATRSLLVHP